MTNTVFFSAIYRDDESVSSSSRSETSEPPQTEAQASLSAYSVIGKAWLACARPQLEADEDVDDSTANTSAPAIKFDVDNSTAITSTPASDTNENESVMEDSNLKSISYMELKTATSDFHTKNILGSGDFGSVFKGWINENTLTATASGKGIAVAVKRLHRGRAGPVTKWLEDINYAGRFHHPNLVRTLAYCTEGEQPMVVYEFMPHGSLADHLFQRGSGSEPLSWGLRLKIALGAAKCLEFLHRNDAVHGNIRPSNILLDSYYNAKLSFGVAGNNPWDSLWHSLTNEIETIYGPINNQLDFASEYSAPECIYQGCLTATGDVYSFGVVLLEIIFGRKVTGFELELTMPRNAADLVPFIDRSFRGDECAMRDARMVIKLALNCIIKWPFNRITMYSAVTTLTSICSKGKKK